MEQSWMVVESDLQHQLLTRAQSATPTVGTATTTPPPQQAPAAAPTTEEEEEHQPVTHQEEEEEEEVPRTPSPTLPRTDSVRLVLELAERSFQAMDETGSSPRSSPLAIPRLQSAAASPTPPPAVYVDKYGGRSNPVKGGGLSSPSRPVRPLPPSRYTPPRAYPTSYGGNYGAAGAAPADENSDENNNSNNSNNNGVPSFFASNLVLLLSHAASLMVGYYIGTRVMGHYSSSSASSSTSTSSSSSSTCVPASSSSSSSSSGVGASSSCCVLPSPSAVGAATSMMMASHHCPPLFTIVE